MNFRAKLSERAFLDIEDAALWYEKAGKTLGDKLKNEVSEYIDRIVQQPFSFPEVEWGVRRARCRRFPYKIFYRIIGEEIEILAVYHGSRDPNRWNDPKR